MTTGVPWEVAGVRAQARETAREAARRSGMSIGEWLDSLILERARHEGVAPVQRPFGSDFEDEPRRRYPDERRDEPLAAVSERLAMLSRRLDQLSHGSASPAPPPIARPQRDDATSRQIADALFRIDHRLDQFAADRRSASADPGRRGAAYIHEPPRPVAPPAPAPVDPLDQALAEIAERQRMLDGEAALPRADLPRAPTQGLSALEAQLRDINARIDTLQPCGIASATETLRDDLAEIGLMIKEAMPRQAIEALQTEVRALSERVDSKRNEGASAADLAGIERGLAEVRDALLALTPAENLVGFDETLRTMSQKIDGIAATPQDPAALEQLESAIVGLRGVVSHVASNEALAKLSDEVRTLADRVDQIVGADVLAAIEQRIGLIADALEARPQAAVATVAPSPEIEAAMQDIAAKLEEFQLARGDQPAVSHLEDRIAKLVEKLDSSDARFGHLESIERGLTELLVFLEQQQRAQEQRALEPPVRSEPVSFPEVDTLKRDVQRTQDSIEAVHGTLGHVVDRLAMIEDGIRNASVLAAVPVEAPAEPPPPAAATTPVLVSPVVPVMQAQPAPAAPPTMANPAPGEPHPIDPDLPPDHPIEPGATRSRGGNSPADRIAASEAALGPSRPPVIPDPGGKANFIAAARRAAQAANSESGGRSDKQEQPPRSPRLDAKPVSKLRDRVRMLLVGTSVLMIVLGSLQLATGLFSGSDHTAVTPPPEELQPFQSGTTNSAPAPAEAPAAPLPPPPIGRQSAVLPGGGDATFPSPSAGVLLPRNPAPMAVPGMPEPAPSADRAATGSIRQPSLASTATVAVPAPAPAPTPAPAADKLLPGAEKLPAGLGSAALRAAAVKGDATAEFEIAVRYADGRGVPQDLTAAVEWFERAAKQGLAPAQFRLGGLYEKGMGVKKDTDRARRFYLSAAQAGNAKAMHNLAVLFAEGVDGKPDYLAAAKWFRQAAGHGLPDSQYNLGILYARGIGVEVNLAEAYKWFSLAAREGDRDAAKKRDDVGGRLDQQTVMTARAAVQVWTAEPQPEAATQVKTPPGGWDNASAPAAPKRRVGAETKVQRATP